uniref:Uncharacterized protein n=1 Tax=Leersia perrieri TaxID=77586 RepID=A0A0D9XTM7_9ORYZ
MGRSTQLITFCVGSILIAVLAVMIFLNQLAGAAFVYVLIIYLCRFVLLRRRIFSDHSNILFRVKAGIGLMYIFLLAILLYISAAVMKLPPWGAVAMSVMAFAAVELGYALFFPYTCRCIDDLDEVNPPV